MRLTIPAYVVYLLASSLAAKADVNKVLDTFQAMLDGTYRGTLPTQMEWSVSVGDELRMPSDAVARAVGLARRGLRSGNPTMKLYAISLLTGIVIQPDSAALIKPAVPELEAAMLSETGPLHHGAVAVLCLQVPAPSAETLQFLKNHMDDTANSTDEVRSIAYTLLGRMHAGDFTHDVLAMVKRRKDPLITADTVRSLGLVQTNNEEALGFIGACLDSSDRGTRFGAVEAVSGLSYANQIRFSPQIKRIAVDPKEVPNTRQAAAAVAKNQK